MARQNMSTTFQTSAKAKRFLNMNATVQQFIKATNVREQDAIKAATAESRNVFTSNLSGRPHVPPRMGRRTSGGTFASQIHWVKTPGHHDVSISLDIATLKRLGSYVFVNEIGTGKTAHILNPPGSITVPSQIGRMLPRGLVWASGPGADAVGPSKSTRAQNLFLRSDVNGGFVVKGRVGRIRREIKGKHFIQKGGVLGFHTLDAGLRADAKRIFQ